MGQKILITDDSTFMRIIIKNILLDQGYTDIIEAANGREGIEKFELDKPDLVLLDIIMPLMGGVDTLTQIMKIDPKARVVMLTAVGQETIMDECRKIGATDYITKPFNNKNVGETVDKILGPAENKKKK